MSTKLNLPTTTRWGVMLYGLTRRWRRPPADEAVAATCPLVWEESDDGRVEWRSPDTRRHRLMRGAYLTARRLKRRFYYPLVRDLNWRHIIFIEDGVLHSGRDWLTFSLMPATRRRRHQQQTWCDETHWLMGP